MSGRWKSVSWPSFCDNFWRAGCIFSRLLVECLICFLDLIQLSCHMWWTSESNTAVGDWKLYRAFSVWTAMASFFLMIPLQMSFALCALNLNDLIQWSQSFCVFFRSTQTATTLTSCGRDLTSSLTYYAAFRTSRRSTTSPGIIEGS